MTSIVVRNLRIGFGISLSLLIISSVLSWFCIQQLLTSASLVEHSNKISLHLEQAIFHLKDAETGQRGYLLTGSKEYLEPFANAKELVFKNIDEVRTLTRDNLKQQALLVQLDSAASRRFERLTSLILQKQMGQVVNGSQLARGKEYMNELRGIISAMETEEKRILSKHQETYERFIKYTPVVIIFAAILAILISIIFYLRVIKDITERTKLQAALLTKDKEIADRLQVIQTIAEKISSGDYNLRLDDAQKDNLGSLSAALNKMAASLAASFQELSINEWLQKGIAGVNNELVGDKDTKQLCSDVLNYIVTFTESHAGALYVWEDDVLTLESSYALSEQVHKQLYLGEGLVGQTAKSKQIIHLREITEDQILVHHAMGTIKPKEVLAIPIILDNQIKGVIELAAINSFKQEIPKFLQHAVQSIATAIQGTQNKKKLQELLEETQAQSEELQAQHSELENMNAELEAHAQKLQTSEEELRVQQEELQQTNAELEARNTIINERNQEIQQKAKELEQSTRYKSEFMANMSHELRTPLNSILLLSRYLSENNESNLTPDQIESANVILNSGRGLLSLIDEILDLSKIEAGKMDVNYHTVNPKDIVANLQPLFAPVAKEKNIQFTINNELPADFTFEADQMKLEQIFKNLLSNALKFTTHGSVTMYMRYSESDDNMLEFSVVDTGVGIAKDKQHLVFEAFRQEDGSTKRKYGGTGLGLSISRELARLMGGEIYVSSTPGEGSTFMTTIPISFKKSREENNSVSEQQYLTETVSEQKVPQSRLTVPVIPEEVPDDRNHINQGDKTILIIEDDTAFAKALLSFTRTQGYKGIVAVRGDDGIALASHFLPQAILLDIQLPIKDGWEVMEELKSQRATRHIPVHIMSSLEAKRESRMKGAVDFINKPVMKQIFTKLEQALTKNPKKVLIVEENPKHAKALAYFLESFNVSVAVSENVDEGVDRLQSKDVDCVILDMGIPDKTAYDTLETVKQNPGLEDLPIIVFTGKNLSTTEESRIRQYADSIVVKTAHSYQRILDEVAVFLHLVEENKKPTEDSSISRQNNLKEILAGKTVLIADDDVRNIFSLTKALEKHKMNVLSAMDGNEAIAQLEAHPEVDIVLMDMMMPHMDGYESTTKIRQLPKFKHLPVIAVTAKAMMGDRERCITAGASDYISKPVDTDQLISLLRVWLYDKTI
jgi:signal transduction histidine kinase/DNA-binding response OmpR family regulator/CHASE3 domain sensor protein/HAMP domain-containing protein